MPRHTRATGFSPGGPQQLDEHGRAEKQTNKRQTRKQTRVASIQESETQPEPEPKQTTEESRPRGRAPRAKRETKRSVTRSASPPPARKEPLNRRTRSPHERKTRRGRSKTTTPEPPAEPAKSPSPIIEEPIPEPVPESIKDTQEDVVEVVVSQEPEPELPRINTTPNINALAKLAAVPQAVDKAPSECDSEEGVQVAAQWLADENTHGPSMTSTPLRFRSLSSIYASSPPLVVPVRSTYFMGRQLTNIAIIDALSASLIWFESHPEAPIPNATEMEQLLENFANPPNPPSPILPIQTLPPVMSGGRGITTSEPATPPSQSSSSMPLQDRSPSPSTSTPQGPNQTSSWANALSVPSFIRTPFSRLTSSIFGRPTAPATDSRLPRPNLSTTSRTAVASPITPRPARAAESLNRAMAPATIAHPAAKRARISENSFAERPAPAVQLIESSALTGPKDNLQLPVHLRGVRYQDLPARYQALVPHLKPSGVEDILFREADDDLDRIMERRRIKSTKRDTRTRTPTDIGNGPMREEGTSISDSRTAPTSKSFADLTQDVIEERISSTDNHNDTTFSTTPVIGQKRKKWVTRPKTFSAKIGESTYGMPENIYDSSDEELVEVTMTESSINGVTPTSNSRSQTIDGSPTPKATSHKKRTSRMRMPGQFDTDSSFQSSNDDVQSSSPSSNSRQGPERDEFGLPIIDSRQNPMLADFYDRQRKFYQEEKAKGRLLSSMGTGTSPGQGGNNFTPRRRSFTPRSPARRSMIGSRVGPTTPSLFERSTARIRGESRAAREAEVEAQDDVDYNHMGDPHRARPYVGDLAPGGRFPLRDPEAEGRARNIFDTHGVMAESTSEIRIKSPSKHSSGISPSTPLKRKRNDGHPSPGKWVVPGSDSDSETEDEVREASPRPRSISRRTNQEWLDKHPEERYWDAEKAGNGEYARKEGYKSIFPNGPEILLEDVDDETKDAIAWKHFAILNPNERFIFDGKIDHAKAQRYESLHLAYTQRVDERNKALAEKAQKTKLPPAQQSAPSIPNQSSLSPSKPSLPPAATNIDPAHQEKLDRMRAAAEQHKPKTPSRLRDTQIMSPGSTHSSLPSPIPAVAALVNPLQPENQLQPINGDQFQALLANNLRNDLAEFDTEIHGSVFTLSESLIFSQPLAIDSGALTLFKRVAGDEENVPPPEGDDWSGFDDEVNRALDEAFGVIVS